MAELKLIPTPYVGLGGTRNTLQMLERDDRVIVRLDPGTYFFVVFVVIVGAACTAYFALYGFPQQHLPIIFVAMRWGCWAFSALLCYVLFRYLRGMPRMEIPRGSREIQFFKFRTREPDSVIPWTEVKELTVGLSNYIGSTGRSYPQHILYLQKESGDSIPLCGSTDEKLILSITARLEQSQGGG